MTLFRLMPTFLIDDYSKGLGLLFLKSIRSEDALVKEWSSGIPFKVTKRKGKARDKDRISECPVKQTVGTRFNELLI